MTWKLNSVDGPVHCVVTDVRNRKPEEVVEVLNSLPLHEKASITLFLTEERDEDGFCCLRPEKFVDCLYGAGWRLADRIVHAKQHTTTYGVISGSSEGDKHQATNVLSAEYIYRFAKLESWCDVHAIRAPVPGIAGARHRYLPQKMMWVATDVQGVKPPAVWAKPSPPSARFERMIVYTCPLWVCTICGHIAERDSKDRTRWSRCTHINRQVRGTVCDPFCEDGWVGVAAVKLGRNFVGLVSTNEEEIRERLKKAVQEIEGLDQRYFLS